MDRRLLLIVASLAVVSAPFSGVDLFLFFSLSDISVLLGVSLVLHRALKGPIELPLSASLVLAAGVVFLATQLFSAVRSTVPVVAVQWSRTLVGVLMLFLVITYAVESRRDVLLLSRVLTVSVVVISVLTELHALELIEFGDKYIRSRSVLGYEIPFKRTLGVPMDYGNFGMYLSAGVGYLLFEIAEFRNRWALASLPVVLLATLISQSRSTWVAVVAVVGIFTLFLSYRWVSQFYSTSVANMAVGLLVAAALPVVAKTVEVLIQIRPLTLQSRVHAVQQSLEVFQSSPFLGIGRYTYFYGYGNEIIHNGFVNVLVSYGVIGFLLFSFVFVYTFLVLIRVASRPARRLHAVAAFAGLVGMTVELFFFDGSFTKILWIQLAVSHSLLNSS